MATRVEILLVIFKLVFMFKQYRESGWSTMNEDTAKLNIRLITQKQLLVKMAARWGLDDPRVIAQSQKVDKLVVEMQRRLAS